ncbi:hypothetical protein RHGRI_000248 [Rhododendron griersonianum]|uniref:F-box domain-containing protein n=1 Tax=Rhododendron griersonianum TaxID=479676 RepID=A0AAV6LH04_9ERIC|nr:hypothetical protein RHGRI_000248 [Rhododendron griersonianum]
MKNLFLFFSNSSTMKKQGGHGYFPDDCWELIFQKLREDDERHLDSISLVSKRFLSISNRVKLSLKYINNKTPPLLPNLLRRFRHIEVIVIHNNPRKDIDGLVDLISRSGVLNLQAIRFRWCMTEPPRDGFKALALNKNIKNNLKVLDCSGFKSIQDSDLVLIADFARNRLLVRLESYGLGKNHLWASSATMAEAKACLEDLRRYVHSSF